MPTNTGRRPRGAGEPSICKNKNCNTTFRNISVLGRSKSLNYCPTCFEKFMNDEIGGG